MATKITITNSNKVDVNIKNETTCILHVKTPDIDDTSIGIGDTATFQNCSGELLVTAHADTGSDLHELVTEEIIKNTVSDNSIDTMFDEETS